MSDISIPWSVVLWLAPILMPYVSIPGALLAGLGWYRRRKNLYTALLSAVVGAFVLPWTVLLVVMLAERVSAWAMLTPPGKALLGLLGLLAIAGLVLWGASHAGARRRGGN
jgi:hypothetical protein